MNSSPAEAKAFSGTYLRHFVYAPLATDERGVYLCYSALAMALRVPALLLLREPGC